MFETARVCHLLVDKFHGIVIGRDTNDTINAAIDRLHRRILKKNFKSICVTKIPKAYE